MYCPVSEDCVASLQQALVTLLALCPTAEVAASIGDPAKSFVSSLVGNIGEER